MSNSSNAAAIEKLTVQLLALQKQFEHYKAYNAANEDAFYLCINAIIIFFMQCGFAFLEAGSVRSKNTTNIIFKNATDSLFCIIVYWAVGYALAYGPIVFDGLAPFIGQGYFFLSSFHNWPHFFAQYTFAATSTTIVGGAVAERCQFIAYFIYCSIICAFVYPPLTHFGWTERGWMKYGFGTSDGLRTTYLDFAGAGMVD
ncbi:hypothetical protein WR25_03699 [Diploscapter pachys]|uniref:Ammonium transporter AmtB-like domain-containing protein n=1 Tax=Diploscapter pachys TaxID=2018661 RepID=A0A2A2LNW8_9BILA|nr:hypothetical protein WR25_03699 [Diploscapter pachys]